MTAPWSVGPSTLEVSVVVNTALGAQLGLASARSMIHVSSAGSVDCVCAGGRVNYDLPPPPSDLPPPEVSDPGILVTGLYKPAAPIADMELPAAAGGQVYALPARQIGSLTLDALGRTDWNPSSGASVAIVATWVGAPAGVDGTGGLAARRIQSQPPPRFKFSVFVVSGCMADTAGARGRCSAALLGTIEGAVPIVTINLPPLSSGPANANTTLLIQAVVQSPAGDGVTQGAALSSLFVPSMGALGLCNCAGGAIGAAPPPILGSTRASSSLALSAASFTVGNALPTPSTTPSLSFVQTTTPTATSSPIPTLIIRVIQPRTPVSSSSAASTSSIEEIIGGFAGGLCLVAAIAVAIAMRRRSSAVPTNAAAIASRSSVIDAQTLTYDNAAPIVSTPRDEEVSTSTGQASARRMEPNTLLSPAGMRKV